MKIQLVHTYNDIISLENLVSAWQEFIVGKKKKSDVLEFSRNLMDNIVELHDDLVNHKYCHSGYESFFINDPKRRHIHKASVRDRLLHHAAYRILYPFFDRTFIDDSYSCRNDKGTHKAINRFRELYYRVSKNNTRTCWILKCDIRKFFASIDHDILLGILKEYIPDKNILWLLENIVESFETTPSLLSLSKGELERVCLPMRKRDIVLRSERTANPTHPPLGKGRGRVGLPLGNLTSQLFANVYMNKFDQWVKHKLKSHYYVRYADDFVFLSRDKFRLEATLLQIQTFLKTTLKLSLHPDKVFISTIAGGVDFLGWVNFPDHRVFRNKTKQRMFRHIRSSISEESLQSYFGLLGHGNTKKIRERVIGEYWMWR